MVQSKFNDECFKMRVPDLSSPTIQILHHQTRSRWPVLSSKCSRSPSSVWAVTQSPSIVTWRARTWPATRAPPRSAGECPTTSQFMPACPATCLTKLYSPASCRSLAPSIHWSRRQCTAETMISREQGECPQQTAKVRFNIWREIYEFLHFRSISYPHHNFDTESSRHFIVIGFSFAVSLIILEGDWSHQT